MSIVIIRGISEISLKRGKTEYSAERNEVMSKYRLFLIGMVLMAITASTVTQAATVNQTTKNRTSTDWYGWHVELTNATLVAGSPKGYEEYSVGSYSPDWIVNLLTDREGFEVWTYDNLDPVSNLEYLHVEFQYQPDGSGLNVLFTQYPMASMPLAPVPEPSSLAALLMGTCGMAGWALRRRNRL